MAEPVHLPVLQTNPSPSTPNAGGQDFTARAGQSLLFLLTILLAGMLLSQLIEEKSNKVIEVLAAAVPVDAIFLGKLLAMLAASLAGIAVWAAAGATALGDLRTERPRRAPAAGGWMAALHCVRRRLFRDELPAARRDLPRHRRPCIQRPRSSDLVDAGDDGAGRHLRHRLHRGRQSNGKGALGAMIFPLSSPYVMIARAGELPDLWMHGLAVVWQLLWVALFLRIASSIFRKNVLKSGPSRATRRKAARA